METNALNMQDNWDLPVAGRGVGNGESIGREEAAEPKLFR